MPYTYDEIFAKDPNGNGDAIARNASITISDPADPTMAPIAITDPTGMPLPNPIIVDRDGMGPAFQHPTLHRVRWSGGGKMNYFTSYEGMFNETVAAKEAAQASSNSAASAASTAAAVAFTVMLLAFRPTRSIALPSQRYLPSGMMRVPPDGVARAAA